MGPDNYRVRPTNLTDRRRKVLDLMSRDMTSDKIAAEMGISEITLKNYRSWLFRYYEVHTQAGLIGAAFRRGDLE